MRKMRILLASIALVLSGAALADWNYGYGYPNYPSYDYDPVDATINQQINQVDMRERREIMHELQEGDYRGVERVIQREEAMKQNLRQEEAAYDYYRAQQYNQYQAPYNQYQQNSMGLLFNLLIQ